MENVKARCRGKDYACVKHVHLGKSLVALTYELAFNVFEFCFKCRIVRRSGHVNGLLSALVEFLADGPESRPVSLVVGEHDDRDLFGISFILVLDSGHRLSLDDKYAYDIDDSADSTDQYREKHASRAGIDVKIYHVVSLKCRILKARLFYTLKIRVSTLFNL